MFKVKEKIKNNGMALNGSMIDVLSYLEKEQARCGHVGVLQYIRLRKIERAESDQFGVNDIRKEVLIND